MNKVQSKPRTGSRSSHSQDLWLPAEAHGGHVRWSAGSPEWTKPAVPFPAHCPQQGWISSIKQVEEKKDVLWYMSLRGSQEPETLGGRRGAGDRSVFSAIRSRPRAAFTTQHWHLWIMHHYDQSASCLDLPDSTKQEMHQYGNIRIKSMKGCATEYPSLKINLWKGEFAN